MLDKLLAKKISREEYWEEVTELTKQAKKTKKQIKFEEDYQKFQESGISQTRPNVAFLYDPRLKLEEKKEELLNHPELKSIKQVFCEAGGNENIYDTPPFNRPSNYFIIQESYTMG